VPDLEEGLALQHGDLVEQLGALLLDIEPQLTMRDSLIRPLGHADPLDQRVVDVLGELGPGQGPVQFAQENRMNICHDLPPLD
jgi:hypothetical protein